MCMHYACAGAAPVISCARLMLNAVLSSCGAHFGVGDNFLLPCVCIAHVHVCEYGTEEEKMPKKNVIQT